MKLVDEKYCTRWCSEYDVLVPGNVDVFFDGKEVNRKKSVFFTERYARCASLVVSLSYYFGEFNTESLFWMREWGRGSPELEDIGYSHWKGLRPHPERDSFEEFPGHLCDPDDAEHVRALLLLAMVNSWDAIWIQKGGQSLINICHDGYITAATRGQREKDIVAWLNEWQSGPYPLKKPSLFRRILNRATR